MIVRFLPEADRELQNALIWYGRHKNGLDDEFMRCVDEAVSRIIENPLAFPIALGASRKVLVRRFPYIVYYEINEETIIVLAVFHSSRDPDSWQRRT